MASRSLQSFVKLTLDDKITNLLTSAWVSRLKSLTDIIDVALTEGVEYRQANRAIFLLNRQLWPGNTEDIDVYDFGAVDAGGGLGKDNLGQETNLEEVVLLMVRHFDGDGLLEIQPSLPHHHVPWCPQMTVANNGALRRHAVVAVYQEATDAFDVDPSSSHQVRFKAVDGPVTYDVFVLGRHDDNLSSSSSSASSSSSSISCSSLSTTSLSSLSSATSYSLTP